VKRRRSNADQGLGGMGKAVSGTLISRLLVPRGRCEPRLAVRIAVLLSAYEPARADGLDWALPYVSVPEPAPAVVATPSDADGEWNFFAAWAAVAQEARATQPTRQTSVPTP
jgi:hypothetical protein